MPHNWKDSSRTVLYPSEVDMADTLNEAESNAAEQDMNEALAVSERQLKIGMPTEKAKRMLEKRRKYFEQMIKKVENIEKWNANYGTVFASSGIRVAGSGCSIDWGLVSVAREPINAVSK